MANPRNNDLLVQLPDSVYQRLLPELQLISLVAGDELHGPGDPIHKVYFPITALISLSKELSDGLSMDVALIGSESMAGLRGLVGASMHRVHVSATGLAYQMDIHVLRRELEAGSGVGSMCLRAAHQITQMLSAEATCSRFHTCDQRLAKWILMRHDRSCTPCVQATHQSVASSLGVRREAVTHALTRLQGLKYLRGKIEVVDRAPLEKSSCECYFSIRELMINQLSLPFQNPLQPV